MNRLISALGVSAALVACGGSGTNTKHQGLNASDFTAGSVGKALTLTPAKVAELSKANFTITGITGSIGKNLSCTATKDADNNLWTLTLSAPAGQNVDDASGNCDVTLTGATGNVKVQATGESVDNVAPVITLNGSNNIDVELGTSWTDPGATATDKSGATNLSSTIATTGTVDTNTIGTYTIEYSAKDAANNPATKTRMVNVICGPDSDPGLCGLL